MAPDIETIVLPSIPSKRLLLPKTTSPPFNYDPLRDPALKEWFGRKGIKKMGLQNGWPSCTICDTKILPPLPHPCQECRRRYHPTCLPLRPLTSKIRKTLILTVLSPATLSVVVNHLRSNAFEVDSYNPHEIHITLEGLQQYSAILVIPYPGPPPPSTLTPLLSAYLESTNGGIVTTLHPHTHSILSPKIAPFVPGRIKHEPFLSVDKEDMHPLLEGVEEVGGAEWATYAVGVAKGRVVMRWANSVPLVTVLENTLKGRVVGVNVMPVDRLRKGGQWVDFWDAKTATTPRLIANALRFASDPSYEECEKGFVCPDCQKTKVKKTANTSTSLPSPPIKKASTKQKTFHNRGVSSHLPSQPHTTHSCAFRSTQVVRKYKIKSKEENTVLPPIDTKSGIEQRRARPEGAGKTKRQPIFSQTTNEAPPDTFADLIDKVDHIGIPDGDVNEGGTVAAEPRKQENGNDGTGTEGLTNGILGD
ncbi:hypothetical protein SpCBS45565_g03033 [Spizellomyces sp. 'palustris']|nr:hypothetical protein SpCBS45565_g03033 [Spizellomyces sp. 'palustris']